MIAQALIAAVAYIRMSSDKQEASPEQQRAEIIKLAKRDGYKIIRWYVDDGIAGWKEEREEFQRLISDAQKRHDFRAVLCWDQNRFSRFPPLEANHYWYLLDKADVHLTTVNQGRVDWNSIAGWLTASIRQHADSEHRYKLSADVKRGKRVLAERGQWQGRIPLAYIVNDKRKLEHGDPLEIAIVRRIFAEYVNGKSLRYICHGLNADGKRSRRGGRWSPTTVRNILTNVAYIGTYKHGDIEIKDNHPAIIDNATFATVARLLEERQPITTPFQGGGGYLFTGLIKCGCCESAMVGRTPNSGNRAYHCYGYVSKGASFCQRNTVNQSELARHVIDAIEGQFMNPKVVKRLRAELHRQVKRETSKADPKRLRKQLATIEDKLAKAKRRLVEVEADMVPLVSEQIREIRRQREQLQSAVKAAETPQKRLLDAQDKCIEAAMAAFARLRETLERADTVRLRELFRETIQRVDVWCDPQPHGTLTRFNLTRGTIHLRGDNLFHSPTRTG